MRFSKTGPLKSGEISERSSGENRVKSCHVCGCHGFFGPELGLPYGSLFWRSGVSRGCHWKFSRRNFWREPQAHFLKKLLSNYFGRHFRGGFRGFRTWKVFFLWGGGISRMGVPCAPVPTINYRVKSRWKSLSLYRIQQGAPAEKHKNNYCKFWDFPPSQKPPFRNPWGVGNSHCYYKTLHGQHANRPLFGMRLSVNSPALILSEFRRFLG